MVCGGDGGGGRWVVTDGQASSKLFSRPKERVEVGSKSMVGWHASFSFTCRRA